MAQKAVIDRIVDGTRAVLLVGQSEDEVVVPVGLLPEGANEGSHVIIAIEIDDEATDETRDRIAGKESKLRNRGSRLRPD